MTAALAPGGVLVEGTCDELGRLASWLLIDADGPRTLTLAARLTTLDSPAELAERLPKALIHRNVPGEPIHDLLRALDDAWRAAAAATPPSAPANAGCERSAHLREAGWPDPRHPEPLAPGRADPPLARAGWASGWVRGCS